MGRFAITFRYLWLLVPLGGFFVGKFLDDEETCRLTAFRDKSQLYGAKEPPRCPTWP